MVLFTELRSFENGPAQVTLNVLIESLVDVFNMFLHSTERTEIFSTNITHVVKLGVGILFAHALRSHMDFLMISESRFETEASSTIIALEGSLTCISSKENNWQIYLINI